MSESTHNPNILVYKLNLIGTSFTYKDKDGKDVTGCPPLVTDQRAKVKYDSDEMFLSLRSVSFRRKIYEPGHIKAEILIQVGKDLSISTLSKMLSGCGVSLSVGTETVAKNYFVNEISPRFEKGTGDTRFIYVTMDIFSKDILLGFNKFSRAHLGQKLISEIVPIFTTQASVPLKPLSNSILQKLAYKDTGGNQVEFIQPYLVQYNESFLSFLRRVTNRCGEMFYFEDGQLCFGLDSKAGSSEVKGARSIVFQNVSSGPSFSDAFPVSDYSRDTLKEYRHVHEDAKDGKPAVDYDTYSPGKGDVITDPVAVGKNGFPSDAFPDDAFTYNSETASEDQFMILFKDKFAHDDDSTELWLGDIDARVVGWISMVLNSTSLLEAIATFGEQEIMNAFKLVGKYKKATDKGNALIEEEALNGKNDYAVLFSKVDEDRTHWINTKWYYKDIRKNEEIQSRKTVCVDMGEGFKPVKLGGKITLPSYDSGTTYVVIGIDMDSATQSQKFQAVPIASDGVFYPPVLPDNPFRKSGPQPAFVIDASDPSGQGRVRIRFPWQPKIDSEQSAFNTAKGDFENAKTELLKYAKISTDDNGNETITKINGALEDKFNTAKDDYEDKKPKYLSAKLLLMTKEAATPWIRMSSQSATSGGGIFFKPENGDEVMVDFENGNIERPYVTGALYSKNVPAPDRGDRVIVSKNGHTIKMDDPNDATPLVASTIPAIKFLSTFGVKLPNLEDKVNSALGGIEITDKPGLYSIKMSSHDRQISLSSPLGKIKMDALTGISIDAPNGDITICGKNINLMAYNKVNVTSGRNILYATGDHLGGYFSTLLDAESWGYQTGKFVSDMFLLQFFDFSLLRSILEIFVRPIDGSMILKSNRYLSLEANKGEAVDESMNYASRPGDKKARSKAENAAIIPDLIDAVSNKLNTFVTQFIPIFNTARAAVDNNFPDALFGAGNDIETPATKAAFLKDIFENVPDDLADVIGTVLHYINNDTKFKFKDGLAAGVPASHGEHVIAVMEAIHPLKKKAAEFEHLCDNLDARFAAFNLNTDAPAILKTAQAILPAVPAAGDVRHELYTDCIKKVNEFVTAPDAALFGNADLVPADFDRWKKFVMRRICYDIIEKCRGANNPIEGCDFPAATYTPIRTVGADGTVAITQARFSDRNHPFEPGDWALYAEAVEVTKPHLTDSDFLKGAVNAVTFDIMKKVIPLEWWIWKPGAKGRILFSEDEHHTVRFKNGETECYRNPSRTHYTIQTAIRDKLKEF